ncbi:MAG: hypothetical protein KBH93_02475 [Anaerolineae bacterium]|nr:hypothetical protein [Anaerolineae bacterium]
MSHRRLFLLVVVVALFGALVASAQADSTISGSGTLGPGAGVMSARLFRDGVPSGCGAGSKAFPGTLAGDNYYLVFGPYGAVDASCVTINFDTGTCAYSAHAMAYLDGFNPGNLAEGYLGDVGSSLSQPFSFNIPGGHSFYIVVQSNFGLADVGLPCTFSFTSGPVAFRPGPDMVPIPEHAVVGLVLADTPVYARPAAGEATSTIITAGKTLWVFGVDGTGQFYQVMLSGRFFWLPVSAMGPNPDAMWNSRPLPTVVVTGGETASD